MSTLKVNELRHLSNSGTANVVLESNATTNLQATSTLGLTVNGTLTVSGVSTFNGNLIVGNASSDTVLLTSTVSGSANFSGFTGEIRMYAGNAAGDSPPAGWLYCNGDEINQASGTSPDHHNSDGTGNDYQPLYNLLKASEDWGNTGSLTWGTNNVKVPDFRSRSPVGVHTGAGGSITAGLTSRTLSDTAGSETHTMTEAQMPTHTHVMTCASVGTGQTATSSAVHSHSGTHSHSSSGLSTVTSGHHTHDAVGSSGGATGSAGPHTHAMSGSTATSAPGSESSHTPTISLGGETHNHTITAATTGAASSNATPILSPIIAVHYIIKV